MYGGSGGCSFTKGPELQGAWRGSSLGKRGQPLTLPAPLKGRRCSAWGEGRPEHPCGQHRWTSMENPLPGLPSPSPQECSPHRPPCPRGEAGQVGLPE